MDESIRQAQGLYAGVALLSELEPGREPDRSDQSMYDMNAGQSSYLPNHQPVVYANQSQNRNSKIHMYEKSLWDPFVREFSSNFYGEPPKAPSLWSFLGQLRLAETGGFLCRHCRNYLHEKVSATISGMTGMNGILGHFKQYHVDGNLKLVDRSLGKSRLFAVIDDLMARECYRRKVKELLSGSMTNYMEFQENRKQQLEEQAQSHNVRLPNVTEFLLLLHANTNEGQIISDFYEALEEKSNDTILQDIMDSARKRELAWDEYTSHEKVKIERFTLHRQQTRRALHRMLEKNRQWIAIRRMRTSFNRWHQRLVSIAQESQSGGSTLLDLQYTQAPHMLELAALTFKDILAKSVPTALEEVVSFIMLSYALAEMMRDSGNAISFDPTNKDFLACAMCLKTEDDRRAYDEIVAKLWSKELPVGDLSWRINCPDFVPEMFDTATGLMSDASDNDFDFSVFLYLPNFDEGHDSLAFAGESIDSYNTARKNGESSDGAAGEAGVEEGDFQAQAPSSSPFASEQHIYDSCSISGVPEVILPIGKTVIFLKALEFIAYIFDLGFLLLSFISDEIFTGEIHSQQSSTARLRCTSAVENIKFRIINPLRLDTRLKDLLPFLNVAAKLVELGWIMCVRDLETYLVSIVRHFGLSYELFQQFTHEILSLCLQASQKIDFRHVYRDSSKNIAPYDHQYAKAKFESEMAAFDHDSPPPQTTAAQESTDLATDSLQSVESTSNTLFQPPYPIDSTEAILNRASLSPATSALSPIIPSSNSTYIPPPSPTSTPISCTCTECNKTYTGGDSLSNLRRHRREFHEGKRALACPFEDCPSVSRRKDNLRRHWLRKHRGVEMPRWLKKKNPPRSFVGGS
ncbi:MAG: hypothetical protein Q9160_003420 [Pyrenula sp. 1 TL-2023]